MTLPVVDQQLVADQVGAINARIKKYAVRPVTLVAVTKRFPAEAIVAAVAAGVRAVGESYAQEFNAKYDEVAASHPDLDVEWHFIGHLQRNKVKTLAGRVGVWETVDTGRLGREIASRQPGSKVLVQVNLAQTPSQGGCAEADVPALVDELHEAGLDVRGLMMIGSAGDDDTTRVLFGQLRAMADTLSLPDCSMGMTSDLDLALANGATIVRVGSAIFGPRP